MVVVSYSGKEINAKLVYYGPGLSGKTTNLESIYQSVPTANRGKMVSMKTRTERTLFFDFLPIDLGDIGGFKTRFLLYTVPGQVYYNATRKLVLRGVDAVIFVADSARGKMEENLDSLQNLRDNLEEYGLNLDALPWVIQYNKRDLPDVYSVEELEETLNPGGVPYFEAVATTGDGVFESFKGIAKILLQKLNQEIKLGDGKGKPGAGPARPAPAKPAAARRSEIPTAPVSAPGDPTPVPEIPASPKGPAAPYRPSVPPAMAGRAKQAPPHVPEPAPRASAPSPPPAPPKAPEPVPPSQIMEAADPPSEVMEAPRAAVRPPVPDTPAPRPAQDGPPRYAPRLDRAPQEAEAQSAPPPAPLPPAPEPPVQWDTPSPAPDAGTDTGFIMGPGSEGTESPLSAQDAGGAWPQEEGGASDFGSLLAGSEMDDAPAPPKPAQPLPPLAPPPAPEPPVQEAAQSDDRLRRAEELARRLEASEQAAEEKKVGFLGRLFGRKPKTEEVEPPSIEEPAFEEPALEEPEHELEVPQLQPPASVPFTDPREAYDRPGGESRIPEGFRTPEPAAEETAFEPEPEPEPEDVDEPAADAAPVLSREAKLSSIEISPHGSQDVGPVVIQRQVQVPITLGKEELIRGATLRLTLEITVSAEESEDGSSDRDSQVA